MEKTIRSSTALKIYNGEIGHIEHLEMTLQETKTRDDMLEQCKKLTSTLPIDVHCLVNKLINYRGSANYYRCEIMYDSGFQLGLSLGYECGKLRRRVQKGEGNEKTN